MTQGEDQILRSMIFFRRIPSAITSLAVLLLVLGPLIWFAQQAPRVSVVLSPMVMNPGPLNTYLSSVSEAAKWPYVLRAGWPYAVPESKLFPWDPSVAEGGRPLH